MVVVGPAFALAGWTGLCLAGAAFGSVALLRVGDRFAHQRMHHTSAYPTLVFERCMSKPLTPNRILLARSIALMADALQLGLFPLFGGGALEGADLALDVIVAVLLTWICGFHLALLPTIVAEALPGVDLVPTWTVATLFVTRGGAQAPQLPAASEAKGKRS